jgi:Putative RNA methylase family UPF0020
MSIRVPLTAASPPGPRIIRDWYGSPTGSELTLHQLSPYIGKIKSTMAASLVRQCTREGEIVFDPFSGCGTIALEAWLAHRNVIASDLSPYAYLLTNAKLFPPRTLSAALGSFGRACEAVDRSMSGVDLRRVPTWVRAFFHPDTLREVVAWTRVLRDQNELFILSCLMGILHHQRPGFLSYPCSHTVPYLRIKRFPRARFPELYAYRSVRDRLEAKVRRAFRRFPEADWRMPRECWLEDAAHFRPKRRVSAIISSPPYMRQLDYGRDNRLRLWFLGVDDWNGVDNQVSPAQISFFGLMRRCFELWHEILLPNGLCVLVLGNVLVKAARMRLPRIVADLATRVVGGYSLEGEITDLIPDARRVRRDCRGSSAETVLVLRKTMD